MMRFFAALPAHARTVALLLLSVLALLLVLMVANLGSWYWEQQQRVADMQPRIARLLGYRDSEAALREASAAAGAELQGLVFVDVDSATAGAVVQQQVRRLMEGAGLEVLGSQVVGSTAREALEEIRVNVTASGQMEALDLFLVELASARPQLFVDSLEINPVNVRRGEQLQAVNVGLSLKVLRAL